MLLAFQKSNSENYTPCQYIYEFCVVIRNDNTTTYHFYQDIKIPSYLFAIAVGNLAVQHIGDQYSRSSVISEPGVEFLDRYAHELSELDELLNATEAWMTPYIWGNYTILILPPSFPFGGMENPLLTFASPTIIVGDKSQVYVATHEIAHSWTGNDVTCRDWSNLWLNEGFTVFEERKVSAERHGIDIQISLLGIAVQKISEVASHKYQVKSNIIGLRIIQNN